MDTADSSSSPQPPPAVPAALACDECGSVFTRADHVARHKRSHANDRTFACPYCSKAFNRVDLLNRHKSSHERAVDGLEGRRTRRAMQACAACITAKARCDNSKPCTRCRLRGQECIVTVHQHVRKNYSKDTSSNSDTAMPVASAENGPTPRPTTSSPSMTVLTPVTLPSASDHQSNKQHTPNFSIDQAAALPDINTQDFLHPADIVINGIDGFQQSFPNFFQLDHDFSRDFDFSFDIDNVDLTCNDFFAINESPASNLQLTDWPSITPRHFHVFGREAFRKSPWLWSPGEKDSAYADNDALNVSEPGASAIPAIERVSSTHRPHAKPLTTEIRDQLLAMVLDTCNVSRKLLRSFPSTKILNGLFQIYFFKTSTQGDSWVHAASFNPAESPIQLIGAIVGAGAQFVAEKAIWTMGLALLESVRLSLSRLIDSDNTWTRNIQAVQTYRMWTAFGLWSGFKRKMEMAESFSHIPVTMLRRAGAFRSSYYQIQGNVALHGDETAEKQHQTWVAWVGSESMKRLALYTLIHDAQASMAFTKAPSLNIMEFTLPLPASENAWTASTAVEWAATYQAVSLSSLSTVLQNPSKLEALRDIVDFRLTHMVILYGFWSQIWNYHVGRKFYSGFRSTERQASSAPWSLSQYHELSQNLTMIRDYYAALHEPFGHELLLTAELFLMLLQVSFIELQQVAGKASGEEAQQSFTYLQSEWFETREARCAVWHAGQVLRASKNLPPTTLRDFNAVALYQASLCLWVYGLISNLSPNQQVVTAVNIFGQSTGQVMLDGAESQEKRMFVEYGQGVPCVMSSGLAGDPVVHITDLRSTMEVARAVLRRSFPTDCNMPPLVENLASLMEDLGELPLSHSRSDS